MKQGRYVVVDGEYVHVDDLHKHNRMSNYAACVLIILFLLAAILL